MVFDGVLIYEIDSIGFVHIIIHGSPEGDNHIFVEEFRIFTRRNFEHRDARLYLLAVHAFTELILLDFQNSIPSGIFYNLILLVKLKDFNNIGLADFDTTRDCVPYSLINKTIFLILEVCLHFEVSAIFEELTIHDKR